jgi:hypothetical protein
VVEDHFDSRSALIPRGNFEFWRQLPMPQQFNHAAKRIRLIVVEPFEALKETDGSSMWFTSNLEIFAAIDEPGDEVLFTFANGSFIAAREVITGYCRPSRSTLAASQ